MSFGGVAAGASHGFRYGSREKGAFGHPRNLVEGDNRVRVGYSTPPGMPSSRIPSFWYTPSCCRS